MIAAVTQRMRARSLAVPAALEGRLTRLMTGWLVLVALASLLRVASSPLGAGVSMSSLFAFLLLGAAPVFSAMMAMRWFATESLPLPRPTAKWRALSPAEAKAHPLYGAGGIMASLLVGMLISIVLRGAEYLAAMPAISASAPAWLATLHLALTADVVLFTGLYAIAFVAALRRSPLFPPLMAMLWGADLVMQVGIAQWVAAQPDLPTGVAAALHRLLDGNISKVLISVALWMPYLLLSTRVNVTYRHRIAR